MTEREAEHNALNAALDAAPPAENPAVRQAIEGMRQLAERVLCSALEFRHPFGHGALSVQVPRGITPEELPDVQRLFRLILRQIRRQVAAPSPLDAITPPPAPTPPPAGSPPQPTPPTPSA